MLACDTLVALLLARSSLAALGVNGGLAVTRDDLDRLWASPSNWSLVYRCAEDPRVIAPRRRRWMGWTINFAHPHALLVLVISVVIAVGPVFLLLFLRLISPPLVLAAVATSIALLVALSHWEATRSRK